jgi:hypothetical protein
LLKAGKEELGINQLSVFEENLGRRSAELITAVESRDFKNEQVSHDLTLKLLDEFSCSLCGTA